MSRETRITLRMPFDVAERVADRANSNGRSMNAEIVARLSGTQANLRDQFAMAALTGLLATTNPISGATGAQVHKGEDEVALKAYAYASAMLAARDAGDAS